MMATGFVGAWLRQRLREPLPWLLALVLGLACPLASLLSPFPEAGRDPLRALVVRASVPGALLGASWGLAHLSRQAELLERLAPAVRWRAELGVLVLGAGLVQLVLAAPVGLEAVGQGKDASEVGAWAVRWVVGCALVDLHLAAAGLLLLHVRLPASLRISGLWVLLWLLPQMLGASGLTLLVDAGRHLREPEALASPRHLAARVCLIAGLLLIPRHIDLPRSRLRRGPSGPTP